MDCILQTGNRADGVSDRGVETHVSSVRDGSTNPQIGTKLIIKRWRGEGVRLKYLPVSMMTLNGWPDNVMLTKYSRSPLSVKTKPEIVSLREKEGRPNGERRLAEAVRRTAAAKSARRRAV